MNQNSANHIGFSEGKTTLIVVNGIAEHGKDTFCEYFADLFYGKTVVHSTVDTVKSAALFFGANEKVKKGDKERRLWSDMKDAWTRYNDGPFNEICDKFRHLASEGEWSVLFSHVREPGEIAKLKDRFGDECMTLLVKNDNKAHIPNNHADQKVFDYQYDCTVLNNGTLEDLKETVATFIMCNWN